MSDTDVQHAHRGSPAADHDRVHRCLAELLEMLRSQAWTKPRPDRWRSLDGRIEVEPHYVMGEATMDVWWLNPINPNQRDRSHLRLVSPWGRVNLRASLVRLARLDTAPTDGVFIGPEFH